MSKFFKPFSFPLRSSTWVTIDHVMSIVTTAPLVADEMKHFRGSVSHSPSMTLETTKSYELEVILVVLAMGFLDSPVA